MTKRAQFHRDANAIVAGLRQLREAIDALGALGAEVAHDDRLDMLGCFASNTLYGSQALIEQMRFVLANPKARRAAWP